MRRVQISVICTRFARYLYYRKQSWIINRYISRTINTGLIVRRYIGQESVDTWPIYKNLPGFAVAEHFNTNGHSLLDAQVPGIIAL